MYNIIKNVLQNKNYELADIIKKINAQWISSNINDEEHSELILLAQKNASANNSIDVMEKLKELELRIKALEAKNADDNDYEEIGTYPQYEIGKWYYNGDKIVFEDIIYVCTAPEGVTCVWSPSEYPTYWNVLE